MLTSLDKKLPDFKPEFVPPNDQRPHFLLPMALKKDKHKCAELDSWVEALLKDTPKTMNYSKPPLLVIPEYASSPDSNMSQGTSHRNPGNQQWNSFNLTTKQMAQPTAHKLQQILKPPPSDVWDHDEEMTEEAQMAEEAAIYDNKLCPGAKNKENRVRETEKNSELFCNWSLWTLPGSSCRTYALSKGIHHTFNLSLYNEIFHLSKIF